MKIQAVSAAALLCLALGACSDLATSVVCDGALRPSLVVNVVDAASGASVASEAHGWYTTGTVTDSLRHIESTATGTVLLAAFGPPGVYDLRVERPGAPNWVRSGVLVQDGRCGPYSEGLTAEITVE
jgi:hypothetical protein